MEGMILRRMESSGAGKVEDGGSGACGGGFEMKFAGVSLGFVHLRRIAWMVW